MDGEMRKAYLCKPASDIIPPYTHDITPLKRPPASVIASTVTQERAVAEAQVLYKGGIADLDVECRLEIERDRGVRVYVSADETFISFSNNPCITSSVGLRVPRFKKKGLLRKNERRHT